MPMDAGTIIIFIFIDNDGVLVLILHVFLGAKK